MDQITAAVLYEQGLQGPTPVIRGTSSSSVVVGLGMKTWETQAGIVWSLGQRVRAASDDGLTYMSGLITAYEGTTLTLNVTRAQGDGPHADWNIGIAGDPGLSDGDMLKSIYDADDDGKVGAAPASATDGTLLGSSSFADQTNESTGRTINSSDITTVWDHIWVAVITTDPADQSAVAELRIFGT